MRTSIKTSSSTVSKDGSTYKKITTSRNIRVTVGDIIGTASSSEKAVQVLKQKASDPTIKKTSVSGLISPLLAFVSSSEAIKKTVGIAAAVTTPATLAARSSGVAFSPGNVAEIIKLGMGVVTKLLVGLAFNSLVVMKNIIWNYEINLGTIKSETLIKLSDKVSKNGSKIKTKVNASLKNLNSITSSSSDTTSSNYDDFESSVNNTLKPKVKADLIAKVNSGDLDNIPMGNSSSYSEEGLTIINQKTADESKEVEKNVNTFIFSKTTTNELFGAPSLSTETSPTRFVIGSDSIYKIYKLDSVIDWKNDVGNQPIYPISINDLINYSSETPEANFNYNDIENTENYYNLIKLTKDFLNKKLAIMKNNMASTIDGTTIDATDLLSEVELEDKQKILELVQSFDTSQKIVSKELVNEYLETIMNLSEYQIKEMLSMALYETELVYRSRIKSLLITIAQGRYNSTMTKDQAIDLINNYDIDFDFNYGMNIAFYNYLNALSTNTIILNEKDDKDIIKIAADYYRQYERTELIEEIKSKVISLNPNNSYNIDQYYTSNIETLKTSLKQYLNINSWATKDELKMMLSAYINNYTITIVEDSDRTSTINNILLETRNNFLMRINDIKDSIVFGTFDSVETDFPASMTLEDKIKGYNYLNEIHNKLLDRVSELISLGMQTMPDYTKDNVSKDIRYRIMNMNNSLKKTLEKELLYVVDTFGLETLDEERTKLFNRMDYLDIKVPANSLLDKEVYYYLNNIKGYFYINAELL